MYPHRLLITRAGDGGVQDPETGAFTPAPPLVVFEGDADVQDEGSALLRPSDGAVTEDSHAKAFLADESAVAAVKPFDLAEVTWEDGSRATAVIERVRRLDGVVLMRWM